MNTTCETCRQLQEAVRRLADDKRRLFATLDQLTAKVARLGYGSLAEGQDVPPRE